MKKAIMFLMLLLGVVTAEAGEPYGDYVCRYIVENGRYHEIYNPIKITHYGIQVKTQMQVQKYGKQIIRVR